MNVRLTSDQKIQLLNSSDVYNVMQQILLRENKIRRKQEHSWIIGMDDLNKLLFVELLSLGSKNMVIIDPAEVFRMAVYKMASQTIFVHNHPTGEVKPSESDKQFTGRMINAGKAINIEVFDHLVISETKFFSMRATGMLKEVQEIADVALTNEQAERMKKLLEQQKQSGKHEANIEMAKRLLDMGIATQTQIRQLTGLSIREMNKLTK